MSLLGAVNLRGSTVSVYRPVHGAASGGRRPIVSYATVVLSIRMLLEELSGEMARTVFGEALDQVVRGSADRCHAIQVNDRVLVESGFLGGERFQVTRRIRMDRIPHQELALVAIVEDFP